MSRLDEVSDEMLMALADGELKDAEADRLHKLVHTDADLAARYAVFTQTRALLQDAFALGPVPDRLITTVLQDGTPEKITPFPKRVLTAPVWGMALAASVLLSVGGFLTGRGTAPAFPVGGDIGALTASLPTGSELALPDGTRARVLASYDTELGLCRIIAQDGMRHVACRDIATGDWALAFSVQGAEGGSFTPASDVGLALIDRLLDDIGSGPPLTGEAESRALSQ